MARRDTSTARFPAGPVEPRPDGTGDARAGRRRAYQERTPGIVCLQRYCLAITPPAERREALGRTIRA
jgi:hypothetical protein